MKSRATTAFTAAVGILAAIAGCSSPAATPAKPAAAGTMPAPNPSGVQDYLAGIRSLLAVPGWQTHFKDFAPARSSDAKMIAAAREACTDLREHGPADTLQLLERDGWTTHEAGVIMVTASEPTTFCPDEHDPLWAWMSSRAQSPAGA